MSIKFYKKRKDVSKYKNKINKSKKSMIKTYIKKVKFYILKKKKDKALFYFRILQSNLDKLYIKKIIHLNKCSRYKSNLLKLINKIC